MARDIDQLAEPFTRPRATDPVYREILFRTLDDSDVLNTITNPRVAARTLRSHRAYAVAWLREFDAELLGTHFRTVDALMQNRQWRLAIRLLKSGGPYLRISLRLHVAVILKFMRIGDPLRIFRRALDELDEFVGKPPEINLQKPA